MSQIYIKKIRKSNINYIHKFYKSITKLYIKDVSLLQQKCTINIINININYIYLYMLWLSANIQIIKAILNKLKI